MASTVRTNFNVPYISRRSAIYGTQYMVASTQPLASQAGVQILEQGGNAADAAVAVAAALGVTEPFSTGVGGDCFCIFYRAKDRTVHGINGSGRAPRALTIERLRTEFGISGDEIPARSVHAVTVPGAVAGWVDTVEHFGSGRVALGDILAPAVALADEGFPVSELTSPFWRDSADLLRTASPNGNELLVDGEGPQTGQVFCNAAMAHTLRLVADGGKRGFYEGPVADAIVDSVRQRGGLLTHSDLRSHRSTFEEPVSIEYQGYCLHECAPNGSGLAALIALGIVDELEKQQEAGSVADMGHNSAAYLHLVIEALRLAFADARRYVCDPDFGAVPVDQLLSREYLKMRATAFDPEHAAADVEAGVPLGGSDTVYFTVVDAEGNACSFVNSLYHSFGSGIVPLGCGFALHDRGSLFRLDLNHANSLAPGKRPYHTIIPAMVTAGGDLAMSYGIMGGYNQPQAHLQVLLNMVRFGMNPQAALDVPRISIQIENGRVAVEDGIDDTTVAELERLGHSVYMETGIQRSVFGRGQIIRQLTDSRTGTRVLMGGSDPRSDGQAVGR
ncbi:hypothetical protein IW140_004131 [Coemansia sp. RSA 1813]|nr:hypothetical protein LPJ74_002756 [Coemansia sp. RSA 1843]KAJ2213284.1 hypothetical protein EV179_003976 [Coemansia sp. RSA 487]KAJ2568134.1 hypothetical protein IW140_004131 [Coemansia sp. RSA 1813]